MARVLYGGGVADVRGKWNGQVHSRNKGGAYFRTKVTPINPNTSFQSTQRSFMSNGAKTWANTLTNAQRQSWVTHGQVVGSTSVFGNSTILSGIAAYQRTNRLILTAGGTPLTTAPLALPINNVTSASLAVVSGAGTMVLTFAPTPYAANSGLYIFATPPHSAGILNYTSQLRFIGYFDAAASPLSIAAAWVARFGAIPATAGAAVGLKIHAFNKLTGAISAATNVQAVIS